MTFKQSILVVDDDNAIRDFIKMALQDEGYDVLEAEDGLAAMRMATHKNPMLILLDLRMPLMDGRSFIREYRQHSGPCAPIIVLTAGRTNIETAEGLGVDGFLAKPFDLNALLALVERFIPTNSRQPAG